MGVRPLTDEAGQDDYGQLVPCGAPVTSPSHRLNQNSCPQRGNAGAERKRGSVRFERGHFMTRGPHLLGALGKQQGRTCIFHTRYRMQLPSLLSRTLLSLIIPGPNSAAHRAPGEAGEGVWRDTLAQGLSLHSQTPTPAKPGSVCPHSPGTEHPKSPEEQPPESPAGACSAVRSDGK